VKLLPQLVLMSRDARLSITEGVCIWSSFSRPIRHLILPADWAGLSKGGHGLTILQGPRLQSRLKLRLIRDSGIKPSSAMTRSTKRERWGRKGGLTRFSKSKSQPTYGKPPMLLPVANCSINIWISCLPRLDSEYCVA
jgi:hypothetical protein